MANTPTDEGLWTELQGELDALAARFHHAVHGEGKGAFQTKAYALAAQGVSGALTSFAKHQLPAAKPKAE